MAKGGYKLEVDHLTKMYQPMRKGTLGLRDLYDTLKGRREEVLALRDVSFKIRAGEWFGLLGPNGAGKTLYLEVRWKGGSRVEVAVDGKSQSAHGSGYLLPPDFDEGARIKMVFH